MHKLIDCLPLLLLTFSFGCICGYWRANTDFSRLLRGHEVRTRSLRVFALNAACAIFILGLIAYVAYLGCKAI